MRNSTLIKTAFIAASLPLFAGCVERQIVYRPAPGAAVESEPPAPPPPQTDFVTVAPGPLSVWFWAPGSWEWHGRWVWHGGYWIRRPHPGVVWVRPHWGWHGHTRVWISGGWH